MKHQLQIITLVSRLSTQINTKYDVHPDILIAFGVSKPGDLGGECSVLYNRQSMKIELQIPWKQIYNTSTIDAITPLIIHEYAHYVYALKLTPEQRVADQKQYEADNAFRINDEKRTWRHTKKMAIELGLWNDAVKRATLTFKYSTQVKK